jgi:hypothetical protein
MSKFKVGDKVRVLAYSAKQHMDDRNPLSVGDIGIVTENNSLFPYCIFFGKLYAMDESDLELVKEDKMDTKVEKKFKVGDKVRVIHLSDNNTFCPNVKVGSVAFITEVDEGGDKLGLDFDGLHQITHLSPHPGMLELVSKKNKSKLQIVYKVAIPSDPSGTRFDSYSGRSDVTLNYVLERKTKTPKGWHPLFAFDTLEHAKKESNNILKCVAKVRVDDTDFSFMGCTPPTGTILCDWVFPIEKV